MFSLNLNAQKQKDLWVIQDTRLYVKADLKADFYGYFRYGSRVKVLEQKGNWSKVESDNQTIGFVPTKHLNHSMMYNDVNIPDKENPILQKDDYYGSEHMFVTVAGLKGRELPNKNSKTKEIFANGDAVSVHYYPVNKEEWVNVWGVFVQAKFLGKRPVFEDLVEQFNTVDKSNLKQQKILAERIVELAWNRSSDKNKLIPAYKIYSDVIEKIGDKQLIEVTKLNILVAEGLINRNNNRLHLDLDRKIPFDFNIKGNKSSNVFNFNSILKDFGNPIKTEKISDECGLYISDIIYYYPYFKGAFSNERNEIEIIELEITNEINFSYENKTIYFGMTELEFLNQFKDYFDYYNFKTPNSYYLPNGDAGNFIINFKNGKVASVEVYYFC